MECAEYGFDNREEIKFCEECGSKLEIVCPSCGAKVPLDRKFCGECGQSLLQSVASPTKDLSFDEKLAKIQKYLPSGLTEKVLSQRDKIEGEKRQVTIMFVDMKGFTPLTEILGPEETFSLMDQVYEIMIHKVHDYEGTVNELRGDGILALFGAPIALEDGPQRAIRASLAMHREMVKFSGKVKAQRGIPPILVRIGINTGPVVVGTLGNDLRVQFTAVGDTINMAARMEQLAEPGTTYITEDTFRLTEGFFRFEALGQKEVKGKDKPLRIYRVIAPSTRKTRFDVSAEQGLTRFIGRERELELVIDSFERAKSGRGQAVSIVGEAGVGKSRLLYEFRKAVANEDTTFLEGKCLSYGRGVAYQPIIEVLKSNFGIEDADSDSDIKDKVKQGLAILEVDEKSTLPYLLELLSVEDSGIGKISMSPEAKKDRIRGSLQRIILKGSEIRPLIVAFEDLHWMDRASEEATKYLLEIIPGARVLMLFTYRPEFVHTWAGKSYQSQVTLNRLSNRESLTMVAHLLGSDNVSPDLQELVLEKTEGVPFFMEEFVRSLLDMELIKRTNHTYHLAEGVDRVQIPSTIQDVIMARVDSLSDAPKEVLQAGSAIEREFSYRLIRAVAGLPEQELLSHLSVLKDAELLYERGIYPECAYIFKHALTREVVYDSMLTSMKRKLHEKIGNALEDLCKENIEEQYGVLAEHYATGGNWEKAADYARLAGKKAARTGSLTDAIAYATKRVECLEELPNKDSLQAEIIDARTILGLYYTQINYHVEAKRVVDPIIRAALKAANVRRRSQVCTIAGSYHYWVEEDFPAAFDYLENAVGISEEANELVSLAFASVWMGTACCLNCEFLRAERYLERALEISMAAGNVWATSTLKAQSSWFVNYLSGSIELAHRASEEAFEMAEDAQDIFSKAIANTCLGTSFYGKRYLDKAKEHLLNGILFCDRIDLAGWGAGANAWLGDTYFESGEYENAELSYTRAKELLLS
jgi:class 3 adenylate cyclase/tetratricopeptide (TPR) repeat protein